jgi:hypothetical protein
MIGVFVSAGLSAEPVREPGSSAELLCRGHVAQMGQNRKEHVPGVHALSKHKSSVLSSGGLDQVQDT